MVDRAAKGPQVIASRADAALVQRLFEMEVPEIYDGTVQIRAAAREAGERTKVAVFSRDKDVDPVRSEDHTSELQSRRDLVCRLLLEKKKNNVQDCTAR